MCIHIYIYRYLCTGTFVYVHMLRIACRQLPSLAEPMGPALAAQKVDGPSGGPTFQCALSETAPGSPTLVGSHITQ